MHGKLSKPIFLIGCPRSGTTVIFESIYVHPELGWFSHYFDKWPDHLWLNMLNQLIALPFILNKVKNERRLFPFIPEPTEGWNIWKKCFGEKFIYNSLSNNPPSLMEKKRAKKLLYNNLLYQRKGQYIGKLTGPPRINFLKQIFHDAIFINIVRDPRAVVSSLLNVSFWREGGYSSPWWKDLPAKYEKQWEETNKSPIALTALQWKYIVDLAEVEGDSLPSSQFMTIKYEDFTNEPEHTIKSVLRFCGLEFNKAISKQLIRLKVLSMNYKWQNKLSADHKGIIKDICSEMINKYDYYC